MKKEKKNNFELANSILGRGAYKTKKAFTLIELLAIIVILAIIAVITVPIILNVIDNAKKGAAKDSAYGYKDAVNKYYITKLSEDQTTKLNGTYMVEENGHIKGIDLTNNLYTGTHEIEVSGTTPTGGYLTYENNILKDGCLTINEYKVTIEEGEVTTTEKGKCQNISLTACDSSNFNPSEPTWFNFDSTTGTITGFSESWDGTTDITIPCQIDGVDVVSVGGIQAKGLTSLVIPDSIMTIESTAFVSNSTLSKLILGENVTMIGMAAFNGCNLTDIIIPNSVTTIDSAAFGNNKITNLKIGNGVQTISSGAFSNNQLTDVYIPGSITNISWDTIFDGNNITSLKIGNGITSIPSGAFQGNEYKLLYVEIPGSVETIGSGTFYNQSTKGYEGIEELVLGEGIKVIEAGAFDSNQLTNVIIPSTVTTIGSSAFGNNQLTEVVIPGSVELIDSGAFFNNAIETLVLEEGVQKINGGAFNNNKLINLTIPSSVVLIGSGSFSLNNLNSIVINSQNAEIQQGAFLKGNNSNTNLTTVYNNSGKSYDWNQIINGNTSTNAYTFEFGTVVNELGNVIVKKSPVRILENKQYSSGDAIENYGGYNWHVIGDDGENVTLIMDGAQIGNMSHCTDDLDVNTDCGVDSTGTYYVYSWDKSLIKDYLNGEFYNNLKTNIDSEIVLTTVCNDPSVYDSTAYSYGGYLKSEIDSINDYYGANTATCNSYSDYKVRLITASEYYNISPYYSTTNLPYEGVIQYGNTGKVAKIDSITRALDSTWLNPSTIYPHKATYWWSMTSMSGTDANIVINARTIDYLKTFNYYNGAKPKWNEIEVNDVRPVITIKK